jgi:co-chaperonin GroES (HSP10)
MKFRPLHYPVVIRRLEGEEKTKVDARSTLSTNNRRQRDNAVVGSIPPNRRQQIHFAGQTGAATSV